MKERTITKWFELTGKCFRNLCDRIIRDGLKIWKNLCSKQRSPGEIICVLFVTSDRERTVALDVNLETSNGYRYRRICCSDWLYSGNFYPTPTVRDLPDPEFRTTWLIAVPEWCCEVEGVISDTVGLRVVVRKTVMLRCLSELGRDKQGPMREPGPTQRLSPSLIWPGTPVSECPQR